jgi:hypothetical protein
MTAEERGRIPSDAASPIDNCTEDIEQQSFDFRAISHVTNPLIGATPQAYFGNTAFADAAGFSNGPRQRVFD